MAKIEPIKSKKHDEVIHPITEKDAVEGLDAALALKQDTLVSGKNIKKINGQDVIGNGNLIIEGGGGGSTITIENELSLESENPVQNKVITAALNGKQEELESGTNIKTVNGESILGEGDLHIQEGDPSAVKFAPQELTAEEKEQARENIDAASTAAVNAKQDSISNIAISVDPNVGTPSGTASMEDHTLSIAFKNLKGETGAIPEFSIGVVTTGAAGSQATVTVTGTTEAPVLNFQIPKGDQGDAASTVDYPFTLVNNLITNDSTKALAASQGYNMGQDISNLKDAVGPVGNTETVMSTTWVQGSINSSTGQNVNSTVTLRSGFLTVTQGAKLHVVCSTGYFVKAALAYRTADLSTYDSVIFYSYDEGTSTWDTTQNDVILSPGSEAVRLCIGKTTLDTINVSEGSNISIYEKSISLAENLISSIERIDGELEDIDNEFENSGIRPDAIIPKSSLVSLEGVINVTTNTWINSAPYTHSMVDVQEYRGSVVRIASNGGYYTYLKSGYVAQTTPEYAQGYSRVIPMAPGSFPESIVPEDAVYLYVTHLNNGVDMTPTSIQIGLTLEQRVENLESGGNSSLYIPNEEIIPDKNGYFLNADGTEGTASNYKEIDFIEVSEGDIFSYTGYCGTGGVCSVGYDENKDFVSILLSFGDYSDGTIITIPSGISYAKFCGRVDFTDFIVKRVSGPYGMERAIELATSSAVGKKVYVIGDSIVQGIVASGSPTPEKPWVTLVAEKLGLQMRNYGISSSTIAVAPGNGGMFASLADLEAATKEEGMYYTVLTGDQTFQVYYWNGSTLTTSTRKLRTPVSQRYEFMDNDADIIIVSAGSNDFQYNWTEIGTMEDTTTDTFYGAMKVLCEGLLNKFLGKTIIFCTPIKRAQTNLDTAADTVAHKGGNYGSVNSENIFGKTLGDYSDMIKEVCAYYSIPVIDMYPNSLLNPALESQASLFDSWKTHPLQHGHVMMANYIVAQLKSIIG